MDSGSYVLFAEAFAIASICSGVLPQHAPIILTPKSLIFTAGFSVFCFSVHGALVSNLNVNSRQSYFCNLTEADWGN